MVQNERPTIIPNERVDLEKIHPSLRHLYGDGMPIRTYKAANGATVRYFGTCLADTEEENERRLANAFRVAEMIRDEIVRKKLQEEGKAALAAFGG